MDEISTNPEILNSIRQVAIINANKLPARGNTKTYMIDIKEAIEKCKDLLLKQIELYNPNILIFANNFEYYRNVLKLENEFINHGDTEYFFS